MEILEIVLVGVGLAMDAFAVSICKGLSMKKFELKKAIIIGLYFGIFQALMPALGYFLGKGFESLVVSIDHWIAFILLSFIGIGMLRESFKDEEDINDDIGVKTMLILAVATSIDALACRNNVCIFKNKYIFGCKYNWNNYIHIISFGS